MPTVIVRRSDQPVRPRVSQSRIFTAGVLLVAVHLLGCGRSRQPDPLPPTGDATADLAALRPPVEAFCGDCHAAPRPESFPVDAWYSEVKRGFDFYHRSGRTDLTPPPLSDVVRYYRALAPPSLTLQPATGPARSKKLAFQTSTVPMPSAAEFAAVAHLDWEPYTEWGGGRLTVSDMKSGEVRQIGFAGREPQVELMTTAGHPGHVARSDLDADGKTDWLIADLGSFQPADHQLGRVLWLRRDSTGSIETTVLAQGLGRVADVRSADVDQDGDQDLVVAEFGWQKTGRLLLLERVADPLVAASFQLRELDPRHGAIHVPLVDLNDDGQLDIVALISQEHEVIEAFISGGRKGTFRRETLYAAADPSFGSSGIQLVDLDQDGDLDIVYTNGDSLDGYHIKPYHAIHWLENRGTYPFHDHVLATLPGVFRAVTADLDRDGDLDIIACSFIPRAQIRDLPEEPLDSLIWLEQSAPGQFIRHRLEQSQRGHVALEVGDFDGDGAVDLAVGNFTNSAGEDSAWLTLWWNQGPP